MRSKKTIDVNTMIDYVNNQLRRTDEWADKGFKSGMCVMLEHILFETNNYKGYVFIDNNDSDIGTLGYHSRIYFKK